MSDRIRWSWAESNEQRESFRSEANGLVGQAITSVAYYLLDYGADDYRKGAVGPRRISSATELADPYWQHPSCDTVDFAVQFTTATGRVFTVSWENPGRIEGIGLREVAAVGQALSESANAAAWDVTNEATWSDLIGEVIEEVHLEYESWAENSSAQWCKEITLRIGDANISMQLAEGEFGTDRVVPSSDNIAVVRLSEGPAQ